MSDKPKTGAPAPTRLPIPPRPPMGKPLMGRPIVAAGAKAPGTLMSVREEASAPNAQPTARPQAPSSGQGSGPVMPANMVEIRGSVRNEIWRSGDGTTVIYGVFLDNGEETSITLRGDTRFQRGDKFVATGRWTEYKGRPAFQALTMAQPITRDYNGVVRWLRKGSVAGVGDRTIDTLIQGLGAGLADAIDKPDRMSQIIGQEKAERIAKTWFANVQQAELFVFLAGLGLKGDKIEKVIEQYGQRTREVVTENPWKLCEISGIGFETADNAGKVLNFPRSHPYRLDAGITYVLDQIVAQKGHCGLRRNELEHRASELLSTDESSVDSAIDRMSEKGALVECDLTDLIYPAHLYRAETDLAERIMRMLNGTRRNAVSRARAEELVARAEREEGIILGNDQREAAIGALSNPFFIITGGPGTGKSTVQRVITKAMSYIGVEVVLVAPTGRAAKRLSEASGLPASTLHRALMWNPVEQQFTINENNPFKAGWLIGDEMSMTDLPLASSFFKGIGPNTCALWVGDVDQLPSVGPGQILRDLIESNVVPVSRLTEVRRQAADSGIIVAAHRSNRGEMPINPGEDLTGVQFRRAGRGKGTVDAILRFMKYEVPELGFDPMKDVQILASMKKGDLGVIALNNALKMLLNPPIDDVNSVQIGSRWFTVGDRVMQQKNNYTKGVVNGEVGFVTAVSQEPDDLGRMVNTITVDFSGLPANYRSSDIDELLFAWAATIHKSQGCEFPLSVVVVPDEHKFFMSRNLIYTGITRSQTDCLIVGDAGALQVAVSNVESMRRITGLIRRINPHMAYEQVVVNGGPDEDEEEEMTAPRMGLGAAARRRR